VRPEAATAAGIQDLHGQTVRRCERQIGRVDEWTCPPKGEAGALVTGTIQIRVIEDVVAEVLWGAEGKFDVVSAQTEG